ncbi:carbohydrate ABC transporter permease [Treponema sp. OttesenSCG-928-L16]|nr:carbohydrate ABC transporter permease [Treponema sp. OttesenSCG-928-L16]
MNKLWTFFGKTFRAFMALLIFVWSAFPILFIISSSFRRQRDILQFPPVIWVKPIINNYISLWSQWGDFFVTIRNSIIIALGATILAAIVSFFAGYAYSRYSNRFLAASAIYMIAIRLLPPIVVSLPLFPIVNYLGINDRHITLILLHTAFWVSLYSMIMKNFIDEIPKELDDAAAIDGASEMQTIIRIMLPLSMQGIASGAIFVFVFSWNEFLFSMIFSTRVARTAPLIISEIMGAIDGVDWGMLFAGVTIQLVPVVVLILLAQKLLVAGLTAGSVKE